MPHEILELILCLILGAGGGGGIVGVVQSHQERKRETMQSTLDRLETAIGENSEKIDALEKDLHAHTEESLTYQQTMRRRNLFRRPTSKTDHADLIELGEEYVRHGGNGAGHEQLTWLKKNWQHRADTGDWHYDDNSESEES